MKKENVLNLLVQLTRSQKLGKGDRLPPERELAETLNISRATVRESLRKLEERGIVTVKRSSGIYLNKNADAIEIEERFESPDEEKWIKDQLETHLLFLPLIVYCAASRADEEEIKALQTCIVTMSRAIVAKDLDALVDADNEFHRLLAGMTKNHKVYRIVDILNMGREIFWEFFIKNDEYIHNIIFAGYVELVNTIKSRQPEEAAERARRNTLDAGDQIARLKNMQISEIKELNAKIKAFK